MSFGEYAPVQLTNSFTTLQFSDDGTNLPGRGQNRVYIFQYILYFENADNTAMGERTQIPFVVHLYPNPNTGSNPMIATYFSNELPIVVEVWDESDSQWFYDLDCLYIGDDTTFNDYCDPQSSIKKYKDRFIDFSNPSNNDPDRLEMFLDETTYDVSNYGEDLGLYGYWEIIFTDADDVIEKVGVIKFANACEKGDTGMSYKQVIPSKTYSYADMLLNPSSQEQIFELNAALDLLDVDDYWCDTSYFNIDLRRVRADDVVY